MQLKRKSCCSTPFYIYCLACDKPKPLKAEYNHDIIGNIYNHIRGCLGKMDNYGETIRRLEDAKNPVGSSRRDILEKERLIVLYTNSGLGRFRSSSVLHFIT